MDLYDPGREGGGGGIQLVHNKQYCILTLPPVFEFWCSFLALALATTVCSALLLFLFLYSFFFSFSPSLSLSLCPSCFLSFFFFLFKKKFVHTHIAFIRGGSVGGGSGPQVCSGGWGGGEEENIG